MYEIEDYEDQISKHRKILWVFSLIIFLGYLSCAVSAYKGAETSDSKPYSYRSSIYFREHALFQEIYCCQQNCARGGVRGGGGGKKNPREVFVIVQSYPS